MMTIAAGDVRMRKWFGHDPARWQEFRNRYTAEIHQHPDEFRQLSEIAHKGTLTRVYSAHDEAHNDAVVLRELLLGK